MRYLSKSEYEREMEILKRKNEQLEYHKNLKKERDKYKNNKNKPETHKMLALYLFVLLNIIIVYSMISMWRFADLSYLGVLITDIGAQITLYAIYCVKAYKGKKSEEELNFEKEKFLYDGSNGNLADKFVG